jgi:hypothetical protein
MTSVGKDQVNNEWGQRRPQACCHGSRNMAIGHADVSLPPFRFGWSGGLNSPRHSGAEPYKDFVKFFSRREG